MGGGIGAPGAEGRGVLVPLAALDLQDQWLGLGSYRRNGENAGQLRRDTHDDRAGREHRAVDDLHFARAGYDFKFQSRNDRHGDRVRAISQVRDGELRGFAQLDLRRLQSRIDQRVVGEGAPP